MSTTDSEESGAFPKPVTARLTTQTYEQLEDYAEEHTHGRVTVAAREVINNGLEEHETETATTTDRATILVLLGGFGVLAILTGDPQPVVYPVTALLLAAGLILWVIDS